jgi:hypothetical protein
MIRSPATCLTTTLITLLTLTALAAAPEVKVRPLDGEALAGRLLELSAAQVIVETKSGPHLLPAASVMWVELPAASPANKPAVWIELLDGSRVVAAGYSAAAGKASIELLTGQTVEVATRAIRTVRFRPQTPGWPASGEITS